MNGPGSRRYARRAIARLTAQDPRGIGLLGYRATLWIVQPGYAVRLSDGLSLRRFLGLAWHLWRNGARFHVSLMRIPA